MASILKAGLQPASRPPTILPPIRYAAAAAAAVTPTPTQQGTTPQVIPPPPTSATLPSNPPSIPSTAPSIPSGSQTTDQQSGVSSSPSLTQPSTTSPMLSSASVSQQPDGSFYSGQESPAMSEAVASSISGPAATSSPQRLPAAKGIPNFLTNSPKMLKAHLAESIPSPSRTGAQSPGISVRKVIVVRTRLILNFL